MMGKEKIIRVMVGEDDDDDFLIFRLAIEDTSHKVILAQATDSVQLEGMLGEQIPDILFLDLQLPGKDGRECLKEIRSQTRYEKLPIIIYSSMSNPADISYCFQEGANMYMIKPNSITDVILLLEHILSVNWGETFYQPFGNFVVTTEP